MPAFRRHWVPGSGQHIISRFVDRKFKLDSDSDRARYLELMDLAQPHWDWKWLSYALMSSHVHHGLVAGTLPPERFYRRVHRRFAGYYHEQFGTLGPVFVDRPRNYAVETHRLLRMVAYHHRNPVDAGVVARASESSWSSHRAYLRLESPPAFLDVEWALSVLGFEDSVSGRNAFDEFVMSFDFAAYSSGFRPENELAGDPELVSLSYGMTSRQLDDASWAELFNAVATVTCVSVQEIAGARHRRASCARRLVTYICVQHLGVSPSQLSEHLFCSRAALTNSLYRATKNQTLALKSQAQDVLDRLGVGARDTRGG